MTTSGEVDGGLAELLERAAFRAAVADALAAAPTGGAAVAVIGLDRFSGVNAALGRTAGDAVLGQVAERLVSTGCTLARLGGDELAVLAVGSDASGVGARIAAALRQPLEVSGRSIFLGASVGVALGPADGADAGTLLQHADSAMQLAKERGGGHVLRYAGSLRTEAEHRVAIAGHLQTAIERGELELHYQPIVRATTRRTVGVEALVRWNHPTLGMVPPDSFIPVAEDTGLIVPLGEWVLEEACRTAARWQAIQPLRVAVNVSARQFEHQRLDGVVARVVRATGIDPTLLEVELTERAVLHDHAEVARALASLRRMGVSCSVDDFGTGYGGLSYLTQLPVSALKIDREFVREIEASAAHASIVNALIRLAGDLRLRVVAEGVETAAQAGLLEVEGCDEMQGYLLGRPVPADELEATLRRATATAAGPADRIQAGRRSTAPTPVRPGPRRTRRRMVPAMVLTAAGGLVAMGGSAAAVPAFGQRTIAAVVDVADVVITGLQHAGEVIVPGGDDEPSAPSPAPAPRATPAPGSEAPVRPETPAPAQAAEQPDSTPGPARTDAPAGSRRPAEVPAADVAPHRGGDAGRPESPGRADEQGRADEVRQPPAQQPEAESPAPAAQPDHGRPEERPSHAEQADPAAPSERAADDVAVEDDDADAAADVRPGRADGAGRSEDAPGRAAQEQDQAPGSSSKEKAPVERGGPPTR